MTIYIDMKKISSNHDEYINLIKKVANSINNGNLAIFPTDTVYGLGTNGLNHTSINKLFLAKNRNFSNPINLLVDSIDMVKSITLNISTLEYKLMEAFFPGAFTIILPKKNIVPNILTSNSDYVGIRIPNNNITLDLIKYLHAPLATTSANISGKLSSTNTSFILDEFDSKVEYILDDGISDIGLESTVVQVIDNSIHILRLGSILPDEIKKIHNAVIVTDNKVFPDSNFKHYQINSNSILVYSNDNLKMINKIYDLSKYYPSSIILCCDENLNIYINKIATLNSSTTNIKVFSYGSKYNLEQISKDLFTNLYNISKLSTSIIIIEGLKQDGIGLVLMNKLIEFSNGNFVFI